MTLTPTKLKDAELPAPVAMELVTVDLPDLFDEDGEHVTSAALSMEGVDDSAIMNQAKKVARKPKKLGPQQERILRLARRWADDGYVSEKVLRKECLGAGINKQTFSESLKRLISRGDIIQKSDGEMLEVT